MSFRYILLLVLLVLTGLLIALYDWVSPSPKEREFKNYSELSSENEPGNWIPSFIPKEFYTLKDAYFVDLSYLWGVIKFPSEHTGEFLNNCSALKSTVKFLPQFPIDKINWWPKDLKYKNNCVDEKYKLYSCPDPDKRITFKVAVYTIEKETTVYYWYP